MNGSCAINSTFAATIAASSSRLRRGMGLLESGSAEQTERAGRTMAAKALASRARRKHGRSWTDGQAGVSARIEEHGTWTLRFAAGVKCAA